MRPFEKKSELERLGETVAGSLDRLRPGWSEGKLVKASLIAGGLAVLTAGSAAISSLRRREERAKSGS
jgi:hypothetical protein